MLIAQPGAGYGPSEPRKQQMLTEIGSAKSEMLPIADPAGPADATARATRRKS